MTSIACAATTEEDSTSADSALSEYETAAKGGKPKITNDTTPNESQSAKSRLVGFIPGATPDEVSDALLKIDRWTAISDEDGKKAFSASKLKSDDKDGAVHTVTGNVTLAEDDISLDVKATSKPSGDDKVVVRFANTSGYKHWMAGKILEPGKLTIDVTLVNLKGGVVVDATVKVKLEQMEDRASGITGVLPMVFGWLSKEARR